MINFDTAVGVTPPEQQGNKSDIPHHDYVSIEDLANELDNELIIVVKDIYGQKQTSKRGYPYTMVYCEYQIENTTNDLTYQAASFSPAGKLMVAHLQIGKKYKITTVLSDNGYDVWSSIEEL